MDFEMYIYSFIGVLFFIILILLILIFRLSFHIREIKIGEENRFMELTQRSCYKAIEQYESKDNQAIDTTLQIVDGVEITKPKKG
jgi:hypothetical protein